MDIADLVWLDATELARLIDRWRGHGRRSRAGAPDRIQAVGERVNAFVTVLAEQALQAASQPRTGPLAGVPFTVKDSFDTAGTRTARTRRLSLTGPAPGGPRGAFARSMRLGGAGGVATGMGT